MNRAARRIAGANVAVRIEVALALANGRSVDNRDILRAANVLGRVPRAKGSAAQRNAGGNQHMVRAEICTT